MTIELYSLATPNGQKVAIALEEMGLPYNAHKIDISKNEQFEPSFLKISPNNKIPAIVDTDTGISIFESGSILIYLAEKSGKFLPGPDRLKERTETLTWLFWQVGGLGPMLGQMSHFYKYAKVPDESQLEYAKDRYFKESQRLFGVLEKQFEKHSGDYVIGNELTIADFAIYPWINAVYTHNDQDFREKFGTYPKIEAYVNRLKQRSAVQKGETVTPFK